MKSKSRKSKLLFFILIFLLLSIPLNLDNLCSNSKEKISDIVKEPTLKTSVSYDWHKLWRIDPFDMGYSISIDGNDNIYMVGDGDYKIALVKFDSNSNEIWNRTWGGIDGEIGTDLAVDLYDDVIVAGYGWSYGAGDADIVVVKYSNVGIQKWNRTWGGVALDSGEGIDVDSSGNIYVTGYTESFGGSDSDMVLIKYDVNGIQIWNRTWGGSDDDGAYDVVTDNADNVYIVGYTKSYAIMGVRDICVVKYDSSGSQLWNATYGVWDIDEGYGIEVDDSFNVYVVGSITEDGTTYTDCCLVKFNSTGDYKWNKTWGEGFNDEAHGICLHDNYIFVSGFINYQSPRYQDIFIVKCDTSGTEVWNKSWDSGHREYGSDLDIDQFGNIYVGGDRSDIGGYNWFLLVKFTLLPGSFTLTSDAGDPDSNGSFDLIWDDSEDADNYTVYQHDSYITDINESLTILAEGIISSPYGISNLGNGIYYYKVVAFNEFGNASSNCIQINVSREIPGAFTLSSDADDPDIDGDYVLTWTDANLALNYSLYQHDQYISTINGSVTLVDDGLTIRNYNFNDVSNGTYFYIVLAFNENGNRSSNCIKVNIELLPPQPFTLNSDAGNPDTDGAFNLIWSESHYANNYSVYQHDKYITDINGSVILLQDGITGLFHPILDLANGTFYFIVVSFNDNGNRSSNCIKVIVDKIPPGPFQLSSDAGTPDLDGAFTLSWNASIGADNYSIYWSYSYITDINSSVFLINDGILGFSYPLSGFINRDYYLIAVAFNKNGNMTSNCIFASVRLAPTAFTLSSDADNPDTDGNFTLSWTQSQHAENYSIYYYSGYISEINQSVSLIVDGLTVFSRDISLFTDGIYYFVIVAYNDYGTVMSNNHVINIQIDKGEPGPGPGPMDPMLIMIIIISSLVGIVVLITFSYVFMKKRKKRKILSEIPQ